MNDDLISRKAVLGLPRSITRNFFGEIVEESINVKEIEALPSAQPELETVKCIIGGGYMDIGDADFSMKCAKCGAEYYHVEGYDYDYNFCPNCGRRWRRQDG